MGQVKEWYKSRTIWTAILTAAFGLLGSMGMLPEWIAATPIDELVTICLTAATIFFRYTAETTIAPITPSVPPIA